MNEIVSGVVEMGTGLQFTEDKLTNIMEAAQVNLATAPRLQGTLPPLALLTCPVTSVVCAGHGHGGLSAKARAPFVAGCTVVPHFRPPKSEHTAGALFNLVLLPSFLSGTNDQRTRSYTIKHHTPSLTAVCRRLHAKPLSLQTCWRRMETLRVLHRWAAQLPLPVLSTGAQLAVGA